MHTVIRTDKMCTLDLLYLHYFAHFHSRKIIVYYSYFNSFVFNVFIFVLPSSSSLCRSLYYTPTVIIFLPPTLSLHLPLLSITSLSSVCSPPHFFPCLFSLSNPISLPPTLTPSVLSVSLCSFPSFFLSSLIPLYFPQRLVQD